MKFELPQAEVHIAIANYVRDIVGINTNGKDVNMTFSATRKQGLVTDVSVTPKTGNSTASVAPTVTASTVIPGFSDTLVEDSTEADPVVDPAEPEVAAEAQAEATLGNPVEEAATIAAPKATSTAVLFGKPAA